ncbi:MAG: hypothetical protein JSR82_12355, partial [Verrucomicrobia bacterium]|nr:hypothetical protein [Verrucomicrobiota bacterium]
STPTSSAPASSAPPLPPAAPPWGFRQYLVEPSAKAARGLTEALGQKGKPAADVVERLFQAAFMHPTIYRRAAESLGWMREAVALLGAVIFLTTLWYFTRIFGAYGPGLFFLLKVLALRALAFLAFVLALQIAAKSLHQIDLPYEPWFRALAYAATSSALATLPAVGPLFGLWGLTCSLAAIMDLSGVDLAKAIVLLLIAGVSAALVIFVLGLVLI